MKVNIRIFIILAAIVCNINKVSGQLTPIYSVPGPEVASIGLYGTVPVSHFTGVPDISIPLYTVSTGNMSIPLTAKYHTAAVKPTSAPGCLGLGWSLHTGGYITRTVRGVYDEKRDKDGTCHGFYDHAPKMKNMTNADFDQHTKHVHDLDGKQYYELSADEFSFNFCGYSGNFYFNEDGNWTVVSDDDIKVEFDSSSGFVSLEQIKPRINNVQAWSMASYNNRFFSRFTLVTPDGCRYEFGGINAMEFSIPYYSRNNSDLIATSWHLSKITTPKGNTVTFEYDTNALMCDLRYVPQFYAETNLLTHVRNPYQTGRRGYTGFLLFPINIKSIETDTEKITFCYFRDQSYGNRFIDGVLYWPMTGFVRESVYQANTEDPYNQFQVMMKQSGSQSIIAGELYSPILHRMAVASKCGGKSHSVYFDYIHNNIRKLSLITQREGIPDILSEYEHYPDGIVIQRHKIPDNNSDVAVQEYKFGYNSSEKIPNTYVYAGTDSWGYYNGTHIVLSDIQPEFRIKQPIFNYTKAETLTSITYPTGGKTVLEYEQNTYGKQVNDVKKAVSITTGTAGGLRVKRISNYGSDNSFLGAKRYYYSETRSEGGTSSGISKGAPVLECQYRIKIPDSSEDGIVRIASEGGFFPSVTNSNTPDVGYSCVIEETVGSDNSVLGYKKYRYSNFDTDIFSHQHMDEQSYYLSNITGITAISPYTSNSYERGRLLSEEYYDDNGRLLRKETTQYRRTGHSPLTTAHQEILFISHNTPELALAKFGWLTKTKTCSYLPVSRNVEEFSSTGTKVYTEQMRMAYDSHRLVSCDSMMTSQGGWMRTEYKYPFDFNQDPYLRMTSQHIINPIVTKTVACGGNVRKETNTYSYAGSIPYVCKRTVGGNSSTRTEYEVNKTDSYGNPVEITENGTASILVWGGGYGQKLIARYENATYQQVKYAQNVNIESYSSQKVNGIDYRQLEQLRKLLPAANSYIYKYNGNMSLESQTDANGFTTYYKYDTFGRLRESYFYDGKTASRQILDRYDYQYYNKNNDR